MCLPGIIEGRTLISVVVARKGGAMELHRRKTDSQLKVKLVLYWGMDEATYNRTKDLANAENYYRFSFLCVTSGLVLAVLTLVSAIPALEEYLGKYQEVFGFFMIAFILLAVIFKFCVKGYKKVLMPMCYLASALLLALSIVIGPILDSETLSMTFFILLFVIALLIVDLPVRVGIMFVLAGIVFSVVVVMNKDKMTAIHDLANCAVFLPVSLIIETMVEQRKFKQFQLQRQIERERDTDGLTTLLTRDAGQQMIELLLRDGSVKKASLVMMDLDNFKDVNDAYGHPAGDVLLGTVGDILEHSFRETDVLVRFGGDEFMLFLPDISEREDVKACMEKIREHLVSIAAIPGHEQTASFGVAFFPEHGKTFEELFTQADKALYAAKWRGKDNSCIYHEKK